MADPCTKFEVSSVSRCRDFTWGVRFFIGRVGLAVVSQCAKREVTRFTRYEAMNGGAKFRKRGGLGRLGGTQGHRQCHHSIGLERILLPIPQTMRLSCTIFRDIAS